ncbi:MAG: OmpA family protein [Runella sp.]
MKNIFVILLAIGGLSAVAQIRVNNPKETTERSVEGRVNNRVDQGINRGLDKVEEGIGNIFRKKDKKENTKKSKNNQQPTEDQEEEQRPQANSNNGISTSGSSSSRNQPNTPTAKDQPKSLKAYSKFDFIPGERVVAVEDFEQDAVGDFPAKWNTNAGGEVVTIEGQKGKWLKGSNGLFYPEFVKQLPDNFTMEFDMMINDEISQNQSGLMIFFPELSQRKATFDIFFNNNPQAGFDLHPVNETGTSKAWVFDKNNEKILENEQKITWKEGEINRISIWRQKNRIRLYINETKVWDLPRAFDPTLKYSMLFANNLWGGANFITNLRIAEGAPDTRSKLITEGKFSTTGILFDVNSDRIKPESYGVLKELGTVLKDNPTVRVRIIGHTDSDGDATKNLDLSKRRAASVKNALQTEFGIEAARMETDGKGPTQPVAPNTTPEGKANNRRVEFVKL